MDDTKSIVEQIPKEEHTRPGKNFEVALLLDTYGAMLTDKQRDLIDLYYNEDLSLGEISQHQNITRQGVRDSIKRGEQFLFELEDKLKLLQKQEEYNKIFTDIFEESSAIYELCSKLNYDKRIINGANKIKIIASENIDL